MTEKEAIKNLKEIIDLSKEEIENNDENTTAILDMTDLKSLAIVLKALEQKDKEISSLNQVHNYDVKMIDEVKGEAVRLYKIIDEMASFIEVFELDEEISKLSDDELKEYTNVFKKMSDDYMTDFKEKIDALISDLEDVKKETDEVEQCTKLNKIFGSDFPIPEKKNAAKQQMNYIPATSSSGVI